MQVQVSTDSHIKGGEDLWGAVESVLRSSLGRFEPRLTRVEVHLSDENADKVQGHDKKCVMEARPTGMQPIAVTHFAREVEQAVSGAAAKMVRVLDGTFGRLDETKGGTPASGKR